MRSIIDIGNAYSPSYMSTGRSPLLGSQRSRRHSSSITREKRSNSKNHKFDIAASSITNINNSINGLLDIVNRPGDYHIAQKVKVDRILSSSRQKYSPSTYERINHSNHSTIVSSFRTSYSNCKPKSSPTTRHQLVCEQKHASIKYSKAQMKPKRGNSNIQSQSLNGCSKNIAKLNMKGRFQTGRGNQNVDNWWENMLTEVDKGSKEIRLSKQKYKGQENKAQ